MVTFIPAQRSQRVSRVLVFSVAVFSVAVTALMSAGVVRAESPNGTRGGTAGGGMSDGDAVDSAHDTAPLKWTPHRAATAPGRPMAEAAAANADPAAGRPAASSERGTAGEGAGDGGSPARDFAAGDSAAVPPAAAPVGPPASVTLPSNVPPAAPRGTQAASDNFAPLRSRPADAFGDWSSVSRITGRLQQSLDPSNLGTPRLRSPEPPLRAAAAAPQRRPERLAMNVDGIPSVMAQGPQVGALDDASVPGRSPGVPRTSAPVPARSFPDVGDMGGGEGPTIIEIMPGEGDFDPSIGTETDGSDALLLGGFPTQMHVESFYDDPYACEDDECGLPLCHHHGVVCDWLRQFGRPYYGWRWYRDFTASAGVMAFTNSTNLGLNSSIGTNEYLNWSMPFWNAFGVGWQVGARATQANFQHTTLTTPTGQLESNSREQVFVTTGFFTRAFEGRGFQGGAVYDYLNESFYEDVDIAQIRAEISYVWGYHEAGFWSATNIGDETGIFGPVKKTEGQAGTLDLYCGFYRLQFGDANEWKVWGGATGYGDGVVGSAIRAPLSRSWALESTFTYVIPKDDQEIVLDEAGSTLAFSPAAWNVGVNLVYYPAGRARRSLASPYRPLFDVADNGSMIRKIRALPTP